MRKLKTPDLFNAFRIIKRANIKAETDSLLKMAAEKKLKPEEIGVTGFITIFELLAEKNAEHAIYEFLAGPFEMEVNDIKDLEISELFEMLGQLGKENDLKSFFTQLGGLIGTKS